MQKVVTLNTCCDIACLTFQLPHITTGSFQSHRRQLTTGSFQNLQRWKEHNKREMKKFCNLQVSVVTVFRLGGEVDYRFSCEITRSHGSARVL